MTKQITARLPQELVAKVDIAARAANMTRSDWIAQVLTENVTPDCAMAANGSGSSTDQLPEVAVMEQRVDWLVRLLLGIVTHGNEQEFKKLLSEYQSIR